MDYCEKWGKDVEEAVKLALVDLKLNRDEVNVTVLEEPSRGFLGFGAKLAKVRVEKKKEEPKPAPKEIEKPAKKEKPAEKENPAQEKQTQEKPARQEQQTPIKKEIPTEKEKKQPADRKEMVIPSKFSITKEEGDAIEAIDNNGVSFLKEICEKMGLVLEIQAHEKEGILYVNIEGKDSGTIIGKRGQTLDAVQYLTSLVVNKNREKYMRVIVNAENYREKRERTLEQLASRLADKVVKTGKSVRLEPMNPYERKVIHSTLQKNAKISTRSEGEEPYRRVVIEYKR